MDGAEGFAGKAGALDFLEKQIPRSFSSIRGYERDKFLKQVPRHALAFGYERLGMTEYLSKGL